jgi:hypothetical protein
MNDRPPGMVNGTASRSNAEKAAERPLGFHPAGP